MAKPILLVIAGCNGCGKSTFSRELVGNSFQPFDYDAHYLNFYSNLLDIDIKEQMAHNLAMAELERQVDNAINTLSGFCYETNFNSTPMYWPAKFRQKGYELRMIYLCMNSVEEAQKRVAIRVQNGGHYVPEAEIKKRYADGFANLNTHFDDFDCIDFFETSAYAQPPEYIFSVVNNTINKKLPAKYSYLKELIPDIIKLPVNT
jgi:predicted ABC-type ATPase